MSDSGKSADKSCIKFLPSGREAEVLGGEDLLDAALREKIPLLTGCGGNARCGSCIVEVLEGEENLNPVKPDEKDYLTAAGQRLACRAVAHGPVTVRCVHKAPAIP